LSRDPLAHVWIAIYQCNASSFATSEKIDAVLTCQSHIFQVKNDRPTTCFRPDNRFQLGYAFFVHSTAQCDEHFPVRRPVNSKQDQSPCANVREEESRPVAKRTMLKAEGLWILLIAKSREFTKLRNDTFRERIFGDF
jgi:hypothetical protein